MADTLPDLKLIKIFDGVVRNQGFSAAQQDLGLSVQAISTYIAQLERRLGIDLCHRGRGGFSLTSKGELYYKECQRVLGELENFERYGLALQGLLRGKLMLGMLDSIVTDSSLPLADVIGSLSGEHPAVFLDLKVQSPLELNAGVVDGRLDVAINAGYGTLPSSLDAQPLHQEQHWLYCSDRHPLFQRRRIPHEVIVQQRVVTRGYWGEQELARHGLTAKAAAAENMEAQLLLILSGAYIGYLPEHYADHWVERGRLRALEPASFGYQTPFSLIFRRSRAREPIVLTFRELLRARMHADGRR